LSDNLKKMPSTQPVSELDLDNIPQPLTGPKSHNPYLDRDHCLLCRRERPDPPRGSFSSIIGDGKDGEEQLLNTTSMPLWLCPECRQNVEEEERNSKTYDSPSLPQDVFASSNLPLIPPMDGYMGLPSGDGIGGRKAASEEPCSCVKCKEQKMIIAEEEKAKIKLAGCWSELSHMVRCVYLEAGTALADEASSTKLCLPRIAELVQRLCAHDPHQLFLRLEIEVEDFVKEVKERLLKRLSEGTREKEHLSKFNLTWVLHNKHLFHSMVYLEPELHNKLSQLLKYLQQGSQKESYHSEESFAKLCQRYFVFSDEMTDLSESWREHQQLIESYVEKREVSRTRELLAQQKTNWDFKFPPFPPLSGDTKTHSSHCYHGDKRCSQNDASKETGDLAPCNCKAKCLYQTGRIPHQNALYNNLDEGLIPPQLVALEEDYNFLQSIQPPNLSSPSSSQDDDSEEMVPIFSRGRCIDPGMCSPCDSIDSDDLTSESSHDAASQDAGYDEDDDEESEGCNYNKRNRNTASEKLSNSSSSSKGDSAYQSNQTCECHACITSAMQSAKLPPASAIGTSTTDTSANLTPNDLRTTSPYLFYPNLTNHQPLDLSHHGITAKHPLIHPHLYNFSSQKPATSMQPQPFQLVDTSPLHLSSSGKVNVYENAKMSLYPRNYDHPDLFQSVNDALQTNSKLDKSAFPSSSVVGKSHTKDQEEETGSSLSKVVCSSQGTRDNMGLYNPAQFSVDAWARQQFMAQQQQNGTLGPVTSTHPSDCCPKHLTQTQRIPSPSSSSSSAIGHAYPHHGTISAAAATLSATQQPLVQPMSPLLGNLQATDPQAFGSLKRASLVDPINGQSLTTPSSQTPLHQHVQHQSSCKKKKGYGDLDRYHQDRGCNLSCMQMPEFSPDIHQQSVCALHNQPGMVPSVGSAVDPVHTAGSTSTSASVCSDPDCDTHNFNDDDLCGNSDDHSSSTTSSSRERDSKHCGCCYCEVFGHGGPALAPMSRNYPEMRERLRLKLRERQQHPKDESPSHTHSPVSMDQPRNPSIPLNKENLEALVSYINGEKPKAKSSSSKAAKRQRQKQRKAAQRAKQESQTKRLTCPSKEEPSEKCQNLSTQSTPTKSNKSQQNQPLPPSLQQPPPPTGSHEELISKRYLLGIDNDHTQNTPASGKLKVLDRKRAKPPAAAFTSKEPNATSKSSSSRTTDSPAQTSSSSEERRKETRPKSAGLPEEAGGDGTHRIREGAWKKADKKTDAPIPKVTVINNKKKDSLRVVQEVPKTAAAQQKTTANGQQGLTNGNIKSSSGGSLTSSKAANGTTAVASPGTPRRTNGSKKDSAKKEAINGSGVGGVEDRKKPTPNGPTQQNKTDAKEQKQSSKLKAKIAASDESAKKATNSHKRPENNLKATGRVNGVIDNHSVVNSDPAAALTNNSSKKKKKKKPGESNSLTIDDIFLPKENVDMNEMDPVELELEAFKRFCMDSTPQRKKEKVVFNVKDIILNAKKT
ncbi:hypothetical protein BSL78_01154, partial [Apostichopus japonicus]